MHQVKTEAIRKLTFFLLIPSGKLPKNVTKLRNYCKSYQKTLNLSNIKKNPGIEFALCNFMMEIDHFPV